MPTTPTSSLPTVTVAAFRDELEKIALSAERKKKLKRWAKNTLAISAGYGAGHAAGMVGEKALKHFAGERFNKLPTSTKLKFVGPALGVATAGVTAASLHLRKKQQEAENE